MCKQKRLFVYVLAPSHTLVFKLKQEKFQAQMTSDFFKNSSKY